MREIVVGMDEKGMWRDMSVCNRTRGMGPGLNWFQLHSFMRSHTPTRKAATTQTLGGFVPRNRTMAAFFFSSPINIGIKLEGEDLREQVDSKTEKDHPISCAVYYD